MSRLNTALVSVLLMLVVLPAIAADNPATSANDNAVLPTATATTASEQKIKRWLGNQTSIDFADQPLSEWMTYLSDKYHIPIQFDVTAFKEAAIDPSTTPVGAVVKNISIRSALKLVLGQCNLTYLIRTKCC